MNRIGVECLCCGQRRVVAVQAGAMSAGECARCGYLGWAPSRDLTERARGLLRSRPPEKRRLRLA